jgi:phosphoribosylanthranilate isomerase
MHACHSESLRIKICCITSWQEAQMALHHGATALGLVSEMPSGPGVIPESRISRIAKRLPADVASFLLTSKQKAEDIVRQQRFTGVNTIQVCDSLNLEEWIRLREALPFTQLVRVIHVVDASSINEAVKAQPHVDAILLDSGNPALTVKELGGTGRTHNWEISAAIRETVRVPVYLAGGLNEANVGEAIRKVEPFGIDVCSGVRTEGALDPVKLDRFVSAIRAAH